jgi:hypothetical protein
MRRLVHIAIPIRRILLLITALLAASCDGPRDPLEQPAPDKPVAPLESFR